MVYRKWKVPAAERQQAQALAAALGTSTLVGEVLLARGYTSPQEAAALLSGDQPLSDPFLLKDMDRLVERVHRAVDAGERIVVYGDYDVDGVTATALMLAYLESVGAAVFYKLPSREGDGYGLNRETIDLLVRKKVTLLLTVDNGVSALDEVAYAAKKGLDVVVTDHHLPPAELPQAVAVVDPLRPDDTSPAKNLSGVGVAFKTICALEGCPPEELLPFYGDLVAVGTVADMMALTGENRTLVRQGLECLQTTQHCGLQALLESCDLANKPLTAENISFALAPRLNAAGRMEDASAALQLLITEEEDEAQELVELLASYNARRQETEQAIAAQLTAEIDADPALAQRPVLVVWGRDFHPGVIGIVASRLLERYARPTIVLSVDESGCARGSGRSHAGFSLYDAIASCQDLLERFGGHALAAGLTMQEKDLPEFVRRINAFAAGCHIEHPPLAVDAVFRPAETGVEEVRQLSLLAPFGSGNPAPTFLAKDLHIEAVYPVSEGRHVRLRFAAEGAAFQAVLFGTSPATLPYKVGDVVDAVVSLSVYRGPSQESVSARIRALRPAALGEEYLEDWTLYSRFMAHGALDAEEKARLCPARADVVRVYREVCAGGLRQDDLRPLLLRCGEPAARRAGKLLAALAALEELAHVATDADGWLAPTGGQRRALSESALLKSLEG